MNRQRQPLTVAYSAEYLRWQLGTGHPTNPERARLAVKLLREVMDEGDMLVVEPTDADAVKTLARMDRIHTETYLDAVQDGRSNEWEGVRWDLAGTATLMATGTLILWDMIKRSGSGVYFNPQGAKHHAMADRSEGFCVLNDMALVAQEAADQGLNVLYVDWDVHHGDGVEELTRNNSRIATASIHGRGIYPGTGLSHDVSNNVYNWALEEGSGDDVLHDRLSALFARLNATGFEPDLVLLATGADGLGVDPLGNLNYSIQGLAEAGQMLGEWAGARDLPVIIGGAGGYTPLKETPIAWASVVSSLWAAHSQTLAVR